MRVLLCGHFAEHASRLFITRRWWCGECVHVRLASVHFRPFSVPLVVFNQPLVDLAQ
jgi:hypothetical protein